MIAYIVASAHDFFYLLLQLFVISFVSTRASKLMKRMLENLKKIYRHDCCNVLFLQLF